MPYINLSSQVKLFLLLSIVLIVTLNHPFVNKDGAGSPMKTQGRHFKRQLTTGIPPTTSIPVSSVVPPQPTSIAAVPSSVPVVPPPAVVPPPIVSSVVPPPPATSSVVPPPATSSRAQPVPSVTSQIVPRSSSSLPRPTTTASDGFYQESASPIDSKISYEYVPIQSGASTGKNVLQAFSILLLTLAFNRILAHLV